MEEIDEKVLKILAGQSEDYLIQPHATAFMVEELLPQDVEQSLTRLELAGYVRVDEVVAQKPKMDEEGKYLFSGEQVELGPILDGDGKEVILEDGWTITDEGRAKLNE